jgi:hypothetical protein
MRGDLLLVGSPQPVSWDLDSIRRRFALPEVAQDLQRLDLRSLPALLSLQIVSEANSAFLVSPDTVRHSDFFPVLEYIAERAFFVRRGTSFLDDFDERLLPRSETLLGRYLRRHPLTVDDARALILLHKAASVPDGRLVRSLLRHWQAMAPDDVLPVEFSSKMELPLPVAELQAAEMSRLRDRMMASAPAEPEPLRMYSRHLMHAYRTARSVFHTPPADELLTVLARLAEVDAEHRGSHLLRLAELAWDRGDDARFLDLATRALVPATGGPAVGRFDFDYSAPGRVLYLLIESLWRHGRPEQALAWCAAVRQGGYLEPGSRYHTPRLAKVVRKVEATASASASASASLRHPLPHTGRATPRSPVSLASPGIADGGFGRGLHSGSPAGPGSTPASRWTETPGRRSRGRRDPTASLA